MDIHYILSWLRDNKKISLGWIVIFLLSLFFSLGMIRAESSSQVVRVGYVNVANYEEGGEGEYKHSAGYEYLQKISYLTGWKYEYVHASFKDCLQMLSDGEIDLFGNVSYTPERAEHMSFSSYPQGRDTYWIYTDKAHSDLLHGHEPNLNGCRIGVTQGTYQEALLNDWLQENHVEAEVVPLSGYDALLASLKNNKVDAIVAADMDTSYDLSALVNIGYSNYFFVVSQKRPDILQQLNGALFEIQNTEAAYNSRLQSRYYTKSIGGQVFNKEEKDWLADHNNTIRIGYLRNDLPFCGEQDGQLVGVMATVVETLEKHYGVHVEAVPFDTRKQSTEALRDHTIDMAGPNFSDFYLAEIQELVLSDPMIETTPVVIYGGRDYKEGLKKIAATRSSIFDVNAVSVLFPHAQIVECKTTEDCLRAVADGKAGSTLVTSSQINLLNASPEMKHLSMAEISKNVDVVLVGVKDNRRVVSIVNKAITQSSGMLNGMVMAQHSGTTPMTFKEVVEHYAWIFISIAGAVILVLCLMMYHLLVNRRKLSQALKEAKDANAANRAKTTFLNSMSHDIRTPMNSIIGFTNMALKQHPSQDIEKCLRRVKQSSDFLLSLINDVLDISRIESGKVKYDPAPADMVDVVDTVLSMAHGFFTNRNLKLEVHIPSVKHLYVLTDTVRIREILNNIISNAVKFTNDGGKITFTVDYRMKKDKDQVMVHYEIADTGVGMTEEFQKKIFDEFSQEESGARTNYKGTGLGMAITKRYVDLLGGKISVKSKKGVGTTFTVDIPMETIDALPEEKSVVTTGRKDLKGVKVLMAEDNDLNAELATALLEEKGLQVTRAENGQKVVELFKNHPAGTYDVILMDVMMPIMGGYAATKEIRSLSRKDAQTIPIIAMTANAFAEDRQRALEAGMNAHLTKPIVMEEVMKTISHCLG